LTNQSLNTLYAAFRFSRGQNASTSLQRAELQARIDLIASTFINAELQLPVRIIDVSDGVIHAELAVTQRRHYADTTISHTLLHCDVSFIYTLSFRTIALTLRADDHVAASGTVLNLQATTRANSGGATSDYPIFFKHYPALEITLALTSIELIEARGYADLEAAIRSPEEEADVQADRVRRQTEAIEKQAHERAAEVRKQEQRLRARKQEIVAETLGFAQVAGVLAYFVGSVGGCFSRLSSISEHRSSYSLLYPFAAFMTTGLIWALCVMAVIGAIGVFRYRSVNPEAEELQE
jgi:hypothetical protein